MFRLWAGASFMGGPLHQSVEYVDHYSKADVDAMIATADRDGFQPVDILLTNECVSGWSI